MITKNALEGVQVLAKRLASKGVAIEAIEETPVAALNESTTIVLTDDSAVDVKATAEITSSVTGILPSGHNLDYDAIVDQGIKATLAVMNIARNGVAPLHEELCKNTLADVEAELGKQVNDFSVIQEDVGPVMRDGNFLALLQEYKDAKMAPLSRALTLPAQTGDEVIEMLKTGFNATDEAIAIWVNSMGIAFFEQVWKDIFSDSIDSNSGDLLKKVGRCKDTAAAAFLLARYLFDNVIDDSGMNLGDYKDTMATVRNIAGHTLYNQLVQIDNALKAGIVVSRIADKKIYVLADSYRAWIENSGDVDILFGMAVLGAKDSTADSLNANADRYLEAWADYNNRVQASNTQRRYNTLRTLLLLNFQKQLQRDGAEVGADTEIARIYNEFKNGLAKVNDSGLQGAAFFETALSLLCTTRFKNEAAFTILSRIDFHCRENSKLTPREAATIALVEYVTDWVFAQTRVVAAK